MTKLISCIQAWQLFVLGSFCLFSGCETYTYRYKATTVNTAMFHEKGDFQVAITGSPEIGGFNTAYALTNHFGLAAAFAFSNSQDTIIATDELGEPITALILDDNQNEYEIAAMYYTPVFKEKLDFECQLGFAYNERVEKVNSEADLSGTEYDFEKRNSPMYTRYFIQPALGKNGRYFDWNFGTRFQLVNYLDLKDHYPNGEVSNYSDVVIEPVMTVRGGYRFIKVMVQMGLRFGIASGPYDYVPIHLGAGLVVPINKKTKTRRD